MIRIALIVSAALLSVVVSAQPPRGGDEPSATPDAQQMQQRMQQMRQQMNRIQATEDPEERRRLMREHMQSMRQGMADMGGMMRGNRGGAAMADCPQGDDECRLERLQMQQQMMGQRMGMMHMMMEQMMELMLQQHEGGAEARQEEED